jgi:hypothetical protein
MDNAAVLELAIETLERRNAAIDAEIAGLRAQIRGEVPSAGRSMTSVPSGQHRAGA